MRQVATCSDGVGVMIAEGHGPPNAPGATLYEDAAIISPKIGRDWPSFAAAREAARERAVARYVERYPEDAGHAELNITLCWTTE